MESVQERIARLRAASETNIQVTSTLARTSASTAGGSATTTNARTSASAAAAAPASPSTTTSTTTTTVEYLDFALPVEVVELVLEYCELDSIRSVARLNKFLNAVTHSKFMWRAKYEREFGTPFAEALKTTTVPVATPHFERLVYARRRRLPVPTWALWCDARWRLLLLFFF